MNVLQGDGRATAFSSTPTREAAYIRIQEEIRPWNRYHNELSLVSRLPPELLAAVFKYNVGMDVPSNLDWIRVSHVCSHWRRVALECPRLWTTIPFHRPRWAEEMLARSKMAPLIIMLVFTKYTWPERTELLHVPSSETPAVKATMSQLSRIKKLALRQEELSPESFMDLIRLLDSPAPLLESLDIAFLFFTREHKLPDYLFSGEATRLSRLRVVEGSLNWQALPFTNLKSLEVRSAFAPPPEHIISALSNMPFLESLKCDFRSIPAGGTSTPCTVNVNLPRLAELMIACDLPTCAFLLDHISYPTTTHAMFRCKVNVVEERGSTVIVSLAERVVDNLIRRTQKPISSLEVQQRTIILDTSHDTIQSAAQKSRHQPLLHFHFVPSDPFVVDIMADTIQALPTLGHTETLVVDQVSLPKATWMHLRGLSRLKKLHIKEPNIGLAQSDTDCASFLKAFSDSSLAMPGPSGHAAHFAFEALCELTLGNWVFDRDSNYPDDGPGKSCYASLKDCLKARQEAGLALEKLVLDNCDDVEFFSVGALRKFVKDIVSTMVLTSNLNTNFSNAHVYMGLFYYKSMSYTSLSLTRGMAWAYQRKCRCAGPSLPSLRPFFSILVANFDRMPCDSASSL
ncbi:hypothetical protein FPV67DRAFT_272304 [Lyophyllum atratum]|nr:hypothetical protein FPV67DRAFT_272304 [Lyophyllum atratum]